MEEIKIRKKRPAWPWILGLIILFFVGWGIYRTLRPEVVEEDVVVVQSDENSNISHNNSNNKKKNKPEAIQELISFADENGQQIGLDHVYTGSGIDKLADALEEVKNDNGIDNNAVSNDLEAMRSQANFIRKNEESLDHADSIKAAFEEATDAFAIIQNEAFPDNSGEITELKQKADRISTVTPVLDQKQNIRSFFDQSVQTLEIFASNNDMVE